MKEKSLNDDLDFFIKNAISCWLFHFPNHKWTPVYQELVKRDFTPEPKTPRPARKASTRTKRVSKSKIDAID